MHNACACGSPDLVGLRTRGRVPNIFITAVFKGGGVTGSNPAPEMLTYFFSISFVSVYSKVVLVYAHKQAPCLLPASVDRHYYVLSYLLVYSDQSCHVVWFLANRLSI